MAQGVHGTEFGQGPASPLTPGRVTRQRDPWLDNVKLFAVVLVVCGHMVEPLQGGSGVVSAAHMWLYAFHVPAFVMVSGYFSRGFRPTPTKVRGLVERLALPYLAFEVLYAIFRYFVEDIPFQVTFFEPWWLTWFLLCLLIWRLTSPVWEALRYPVLISVAISTAAGLNPLPNEFESGRLLQMLPFFVIGMRVEQRHLDALRTPVAKVLGAVVLAIGLVVALVITPEVSSGWTLMIADYKTLHVGQIDGALFHVAQLVVEVVLVAAFVAVVPRSSLRISALAAGTMYAYLLHGFVVRSAIASGLFDVPFVASPEGTVLLIVASALLALALMTAPVRAVFRPVVEPRVDWLFPRPAARTTATTAQSPSP